MSDGAHIELCTAAVAELAAQAQDVAAFAVSAEADWLSGNLAWQYRLWLIEELRAYRRAAETLIGQGKGRTS
jgi:hypothetical protein